ncbi:2-dehydropantoate 2-reductase [Rhodocytophaga rosea]|uniref:2-dehydropantoate 2-reductase n=1 Tax=Rhodocytophaga rosea TaxID=2704465 RepID=A0A6C0GHB3_9BACT|nr:2-dehydropantoate 2-reductase [Rhodocytophaga rosea]QHT67347.1 2-dehydropantoate 2-reductase [Rhodocytophaga rosea]
MEGKKITIIGLGGVGGYFGFKLAYQYKNNPTVKITFVARGETYTRVKASGLTLLSPEHVDPVVRPDTIIDEIAHLPESDLILICVKEYDLEQVCLQIKEKIKADTLLLPLMNGVDIYERMRNIITTGVVFPACVYVASHIKEKGVVEHKGNRGKIIVGKDPQKKSREPTWVVDVLKESGVDIIYKENALPDIWIKFFFIASFGLVSARYNKPIGQVYEEPELRARARAIMREIQQITIGKGITIPEDIIELTFEKASTFPYHTPTSLQLDVHSNKAHTELELFAGAIIHYGRALHIPVMETEKIYAEIRQNLVK